MRILITGGAGFIGSHLAEHLLRCGHEVVVLDDLSSGSLDNIALLSATPGFAFHRGSIFNAELVSALMAGCDAVYHLAAAVGVKRILQQPVQTLETNVAGTEIVLRQAAARGLRTVVASSSEVYGKSTELPFREDADLLLGPAQIVRWGYACSKLMDEFMALAYHLQMKLAVTVMRLFNTVGARQSSRYGMVLPTMVRQALRGQDVTVHGDGSQTRCFTHVADVAEGLAALLDHPATIGGIYNLGSTEEISILALAERVVRATGSGSKIICVPYQKAYGPGYEDMQRRVPDITRAQRDMGFTPRRGLEKILSEVIDYERSSAMATEAIRVAGD
jgi:UDP-glucose 4-epimerase